MEKVLTFLKNRRTIIAAILVTLLLAVAAFLVLYRLQAEPFQDYDEATYAEVVTENLVSHSITFTFLKNPFFHKPPLLFWMMDASKTLISNTEFADRLPSAFSALAIIALTVIFIYAATGSFAAALVSGTIALTTSALIEPARQVRFDVLVAFFNTLAFYAFWRALKQQEWFLLFGVALGLAVLSKGPLAIYGLAAIFGLVLVERKISWLWNKYFWGGIGIALLIILPWHIYETLQYGLTFWQMYVGDQVLERVGHTLFTRQPSNTGYLMYALTFGAPWTELFGFAVISAGILYKRYLPATRGIFWGSTVAVLAVLVVDFISQTKAFSYLIPLYPFLALAVGIALFEIFRLLRPVEKGAAALLVGICLIGAFGWTTYNALHLNPYYSYQIALAKEEVHIAELLRAHAPGDFTDYEATNLGVIMFYSGMVQPKFLPSAEQPAAGEYILYNEGELAALKAKYPAYTFTSAYIGRWLSVVVVN